MVNEKKKEKEGRRKNEIKNEERRKEEEETEREGGMDLLLNKTCSDSLQGASKRTCSWRVVEKER